MTVGVFGSVGRGTPGPYSDVDTLIIANPLQRGRGRRLRDFDAVEAALSDVLAAVARRGCYTTISPVIKTPEEAAAGSLLFLDMIDDLRLLYDREGFFRNQLDGFAARGYWEWSRRRSMTWARSFWSTAIGCRARFGPMRIASPQHLAG